jgi:hypothetical protein
MKKLYIILFAAGLSAWGCNKKAADTLERDMGEFETKWAGLKNGGSIWNKELGDEVKACREDNRKAEEFVKANPRVLPDEKLKCTRFLDSCLADQKRLDELWEEWTVTDSLWERDSSEWDRWKNDWNAGRLNIELARKDLAGWNNKHKDYIQRLADWKSEFEALKWNYHRHRREMRSSCGLLAFRN